MSPELVKKIAIITPAFPGATLPLAKHFVENGHQVDYYFISSNGGMINVTEGADFKAFKAKKMIGEVEYQICPALYDYLGSKKLRLLYYRRPRPYKRVPIIRSIVAAYLAVYDKIFCRHINYGQYDFINMVGTSRTEGYNNLLRNIRIPIIVSLHEVVSRSVDKSNLKTPKWMSRLFSSNNADVVVHSQNTFEAINKYYKELSLGKVHVIHFGLFETYKCVKPDNEILNQLPKKYLLFFGSILPYKGLDILYEAVNKHREWFKDYKVVVAGRGHVDCVESIKKDDAFVCINRYITNGELVSLIVNSLFIICPYREISQSGIPQTAFVFNKPIVASNLNAFKEVMTDGQNCLLFESGNSEELAVKMRQMIDNYKHFKNNIINFEENNPHFAWQYIAKQYEFLVEKRG